MHSRLGSCGRPVRKLWHVCVQSVLLSPRYHSTNNDMWLSGGLYARLIPLFTTSFSTSYLRNLSLLFAYFYPISTIPTRAATSSLNLIKPLAAVEELAI